MREWERDKNAPSEYKQTNKQKWRFSFVHKICHHLHVQTALLIDQELLYKQHVDKCLTEQKSMGNWAIRESSEIKKSNRGFES